MARPLRIQFPGAFYFVTSRANDDRTIFVSRKDREKFLEILSIAHKRFGFIVHAYTIMPHYYQLLVETPHANISKGMQFINSNYNTHYLFRHSWVGHLFNGRFKAILVDPETYLEEVSRMIHLTAIKEKIVTRPEEYEWSSYHYFVHDKPAPDFLNVDFTLRRDGANLFVAMERYRNFVLQGVDQKIPNPLKKIVKQTILGSAEFSARMVELFE
jgi:REP element-mobilizing transposase RayT